MNIYFFRNPPSWISGLPLASHTMKLASHTMKNSFIEFLNLGTIEIAFEIVKLRCVQAEIYKYYSCS